MNVYVEYDLKNQSGKGKFIQRLTREWDKMGVKYSGSPEGCTVRLALTRFRTQSKLPTVLRIDGSHNEFNLEYAKYKLSKKEAKKKLEWKNHLVAENIKKAKAVIWQSKFCKREGRKTFGVKPRKDYVVFNGTDPADYGARCAGSTIRKVLMMAKWAYRPHKRLKEMVAIAREYKSKDATVEFHIYGTNDFGDLGVPWIINHGQTEEADLRKALPTFDCMLNLAYYDWCPNAVVEALVAGVPVICANGTGVEEIVKDCGICVNIDTEPHDIVRRIQPPPFDPAPVYKALDDVLFSEIVFPPACHLYIADIAKKYLEVLKDVSNG